VLRCSELVESDARGRGLPFLPCERCLAPSKAAEARAEFDPLAAEVDAWLANVREIDETLRPRRPFVHIETEHFQLAFGLPKVSLERRVTLKQHEAAHLYAERLEAHYAWFQDILDYDDELARVKKHQLILCDDLRTLVQAAQIYAHLNTDRAGRAVGDPSIFVTWRDKSVFKKADEAFHRHVLHHMTHQYLGVYFMKVWLVERAGWLEEGLANYAEMIHFGSAGNSCNIESAEEDMADEAWASPTKKLVLKGEAIPFAQLSRKRADQMGRDDHLQAWSIVDWIMTTAPDKLPALVQDLKQDVPLRDSFRTHFGHSIVGFDEVWQEWVKETYELEP
ncbi:MAG: hypothetical protein ACF8XB_22290, partial [Planctomycetota bacterium JB042]